MNKWSKYNHIRIISSNDDLRNEFSEGMGRVRKVDAWQFKTLAHLAQNDSDYLVRINAIESLGRIATARVIRVLEKCLVDKNPQVRGYSAQNLAEASGKKSRTLLMKLSSKETNPWTKHALHLALFKAGDHGVLNKILSGLEANKFYFRSVLLNGIADIQLNKIEKKIVATALEDRLSREPSPVLADKMRRLLKNKFKHLPAPK